ncbi:DNA repair protein [Micromonospora sp. 15K316]|uniref:DNA repair protein n=1 Tax=Micromonospora sp. 15K316 TaxID=2530376 RepID=UPI00104CF8D5|nr:DNA repair protein [Micromonospora sp. 15K316]TDC38586.1 DNA repair protein [Micromonospora sp. 15K316]
MPNQPNDRHQQDTERLWRNRRVPARFPAQPPYRGVRAWGDPDRALGWAELNKLPAGASARHGRGGR